MSRDTDSHQPTLTYHSGLFRRDQLVFAKDEVSHRVLRRTQLTYTNHVASDYQRFDSAIRLASCKRLFLVNVRVVLGKLRMIVELLMAYRTEETLLVEGQWRRVYLGRVRVRRS